MTTIGRKGPSMFKSTAVVALAALMIGGTSSAAQEPAAPAHGHWQLIVSSGRFIPTGAQRAAVERGKATVAQVSYALQEGLALTTSFGWARTRDVAGLDSPRLDMFTYDVGAEVRAGKWLDRGRLSFSPFAGAGAGGRTYDYRGLAVHATHNLAGYVSAGGELGIAHRVTLRLEARDYLTGFKPLNGGGATEARNDVTVMAGLRLGVR